MAKPDHLLNVSSSRHWEYLLALVGILLFVSFLVSIILTFGIPSTFTLPYMDQYDVNEKFEAVRDEEEEGRQKWVEVISWEPRAFLYHNFLSKEECNHLIELAKPYMKRSQVIGTRTNTGITSRHRTSSGMFLSRGQDKVVQDIEKRIADFTHIPIENGEDLQILHYGIGEEYQKHHDFISQKLFIKHQDERIASMLMYLSDVEEGGETVFPRAKLNSKFSSKHKELSQCGQGGIAVKPKMGNALLFWSLHPNSTLDTLALHAGCPVIRGDKWSSTKWLRNHEWN